MAKWIQGAIKRPGALRRHFGVGKGEKIPPSELASTINRLRAKSKKGKLSVEELRLLRQALLARKLKGFH